MTTSYATVQTRLAGAYLAELGRNWHREEHVLAQSPAHVEIPFPIGRATLDAEGDVLNITLTANSNRDSTLLEDLISDQLDRLSSDEDLRYQWVRTPEELPIARSGVHASRTAFRFFR